MSYVSETEKQHSLFGRKKEYGENYGLSVSSAYGQALDTLPLTLGNSKIIFRLRKIHIYVERERESECAAAYFSIFFARLWLNKLVSFLLADSLTEDADSPTESDPGN